MSLRETLEENLSGVLGVVALLGHGLGLLDPLLQLIGSTAGTWYPLLGVLWRLGDLVPAVPQEALTTLLVGGTVVYALYLGDSLLDRVLEFIR